MEEKLLQLAAKTIVHINQTGNDYELGEKIRHEYNLLFNKNEQN